MHPIEAGEVSVNDAVGLNSLGQPIGPALPRFSPRPPPSRRTLVGRWCHLVPLDPETHATGLSRAFSDDREGSSWTYLPYGPFPSAGEFGAWLGAAAQTQDPLFFCVIEPEASQAVGVLSLMRVDSNSGCIEIGHVHFAPGMRNTRMSTEAVALLARHVFEDLAYRRLEWKCDSLNAPSRRAALRLGFQFEGLFRQHVVYKGRSRDTTWYAMLDRDWPKHGVALQRWLDPSNFDERGQQRRSLAACRENVE